MDRANNILFYLFLLVVILAPLPLGSNREWSWTLCAVLISTLTLAWSLLSLVSPTKQTFRLNPYSTQGKHRWDDTPHLCYVSGTLPEHDSQLLCQPSRAWYS